jgi:hypothetical protein
MNGLKEAKEARSQTIWFPSTFTQEKERKTNSIHSMESADLLAQIEQLQKMNEEAQRKIEEEQRKREEEQRKREEEQRKREEEQRKREEEERKRERFEKLFEESEAMVKKLKEQYPTATTFTQLFKKIDWSNLSIEPASLPNGIDELYRKMRDLVLGYSFEKGFDERESYPMFENFFNTIKSDLSKLLGISSGDQIKIAHAPYEMPLGKNKPDVTFFVQGNNNSRATRLGVVEIKKDDTIETADAIGQTVNNLHQLLNEYGGDEISSFIISQHRIKFLYKKANEYQKCYLSKTLELWDTQSTKATPAFLQLCHVLKGFFEKGK